MPQQKPDPATLEALQRRVQQLEDAHRDVYAKLTCLTNEQVVVRSIHLSEAELVTVEEWKQHPWKADDIPRGLKAGALIVHEYTAFKNNPMREYYPGLEVPDQLKGYQPIALIPTGHVQGGKMRHRFQFWLIGYDRHDHPTWK